MIGAFTYHKAIAPMIWVLIGLSTIELIVEHLLLAHWWPRVAIGIGLATISGIAWLVLVVRSFRTLPVMLDDHRLLMRIGRLRSISVPIDHIARLRHPCDVTALKRRDVMNFALLAFPNVVVELASPMLVGRRHIRSIAHRLDDPASFTEALNRILFSQTGIIDPGMT